MHNPNPNPNPSPSPSPNPNPNPNPHPNLNYYEVLAASGEFSMGGAAPGRAVDAEAWALAEKAMKAVSAEQVLTAAAVLTAAYSYTRPI